MLVGAVGPQRAVGSLAVLGLVLSVLTLAGERRRPEADPGLTAALSLWSIPGLALGTVALRLAPRALLEGLVALGVVLAALVRLAPGTAARAPVGRRTAGVLSGAFGTSTGLSGPPLVLHLLEDPARTPSVTRDTLAAVFLLTDVLALAVLAAGGALALGDGLAGLLGATVAGQLVGRAAFGRLSPAAFAHLGLVVLVAAGALTLGLVLR